MERKHRWVQSLDGWERCECCECGAKKWHSEDDPSTPCPGAPGPTLGVEFDPETKRRNAETEAFADRAVETLITDEDPTDWFQRVMRG